MRQLCSASLHCGQGSSSRATLDEKSYSYSYSPIHDGAHFRRDNQNGKTSDVSACIPGAFRMLFFFWCSAGCAPARAMHESDRRGDGDDDQDGRPWRDPTSFSILWFYFILFYSADSASAGVRVPQGLGGGDEVAPRGPTSPSADADGAGAPPARVHVSPRARRPRHPACFSWH